jgi:hypothetical protein
MFVKKKITLNLDPFCPGNSESEVTQEHLFSDRVNGEKILKEV